MNVIYTNIFILLFLQHSKILYNQNPTSPLNAPNNHDINLTINNLSSKVHNPEQTLLIFHIKHLVMFSEDLRALGKHVNEFCAFSPLCIERLSIVQSFPI